MNQNFADKGPFIDGGLKLASQALSLSAKHGKSITASCIRCRFPICQCSKKVTVTL